MLLFPPDHPYDVLSIEGVKEREAVRIFFASRLTEESCIVQFHDGSRARWRRTEVQKDATGTVGGRFTAPPISQPRRSAAGGNLPRGETLPPSTDNDNDSEGCDDEDQS